MSLQKNCGVVVPINIRRTKYLNKFLLKYQSLLLKISIKKRQTRLTGIGGEWYLNNVHNTRPPMNKLMSRNKQQEEDKKLKGGLKFACDHWKDWKFQIHWENWIFLCHLNAILRRLHFLCLLKSSFFMFYKIIIGWGNK